MRVIRTMLSGATVAALCHAAMAQYVNGNEAVRVTADGSTRVETPPIPAAGLPPPCPAAKAGCAGGGWRMVETTAGIQECTEIYARPGTCRASTYGMEKRSRVWIVKKSGQWMQCQRPDLASKCVSTKALPYSEVQ
jgi:hypothetical protein